MEVAPIWRMQGSRYLGAGSRPWQIEIDNEKDTFYLKNMINGRELNMNHGQVEAWAEALVKTAKEFKYDDPAVVRKMAGEAAQQLNGRGEQFMKAAEEAIEKIYG